MKIRILIVDDHRVMLEGVRSLLEKQPDFTVVGEADNGRVAVQKVRELSPQIVVMDIAMANQNGIEATRQIVKDHRHVKVLILSMLADRRTVAKAFAAGASGYVLKESAFKEVVEAIRTVMSGKVYLSSPISGIVIEDYVHNLVRLSPSANPILTDREQEVLQLLAEGQSAKEIASTLHVSVKTVNAHRTNIMEKLKFQNFADLVKYAIQEGLTSLDHRAESAPQK